MTARTHLVSSLSVALLPVLVVPIPLQIMKMYLVGAIIGALFPDLDETKSFIGSRTRLISDVLNALFGHRGITHTIAAVMLYAGMLAFAWLFMSADQVTLGEYLMLSVGFLLGNILHSMGDMMTKEGGIALFYPFSSRRLYMLPTALRFKTNGWIENLIVTPTFTVLLVIEGWHLLGGENLQ